MPAKYNGLLADSYACLAVVLSNKISDPPRGFDFHPTYNYREGKLKGITRYPTNCPYYSELA